jgi:ATP-dependent protease ClpP protease subunit
MHHVIKYEHDRAIVRLLQPVSNQSMIWLCDEIDLAIGYYFYRHVDIHIDSPGGAVTGLDYFTTRLQSWRDVDGLVLGTLAMAEVSSAAALILSSGTIGHRRAYPSARLLYHDSRIQPHDKEVWTRDRLEAASRTLAESDQRQDRALALYIMEQKIRPGGDHQGFAVVPGHRGGDLKLEETTIESADQLAQIYATLNTLDVRITPEDAVKLHLIDRIER